MPSIVLELQKNCRNPDLHVAYLLRDALTVARKLKVTDIEEWLNREMRGYHDALPEELPEYRKLPGIPKAMGSFSRWFPIQFGEKTTSSFPEGFWSLRPISHAASELEQLIKENDSGEVILFYPDKIIALLVKNDSDVIAAGVAYNTSQLQSIIERVRDTILIWALDLESKGILGNDETQFTKDEVMQAQTINIGTFHGVYGNVSSSNVQVGNYNAIHDLLKKSGIPQDERNELENIIDEANEMPEDKRTSLKHRATEWLGRNKSFLLTGSIEVTKLLHELKVF